MQKQYSRVHEWEVYLQDAAQDYLAVNGKYYKILINIYTKLPYLKLWKRSTLVDDYGTGVLKYITNWNEIPKFLINE